MEYREHCCAEDAVLRHDSRKRSVPYPDNRTKCWQGTLTTPRQAKLVAVIMPLFIEKTVRIQHVRSRCLSLLATASVIVLSGGCHSARSVTIGGQVVDDDSGRPVAGASICFRSAFGNVTVDNEYRMATSDANGRFEFRRVKVRDALTSHVSLCAMKKGYDWTNVSLGKSTGFEDHLEIRLEADRDIRLPQGILRIEQCSSQMPTNLHFVSFSKTIGSRSQAMTNRPTSNFILVSDPITTVRTGCLAAVIPQSQGVHSSLNRSRRQAASDSSLTIVRSAIRRNCPTSRSCGCLTPSRSTGRTIVGSGGKMNFCSRHTTADAHCFTLTGTTASNGSTNPMGRWISIGGERSPPA